MFLQDILEKHCYKKVFTKHKYEIGRYTMYNFVHITGELESSKLYCLDKNLVDIFKVRSESLSLVNLHFSLNFISRGGKKNNEIDNRPKYE